MENGTLASPATARASIVLPTPGAPKAKRLWEFWLPIAKTFGEPQKFHNFFKLFFGFLAPPRPQTLRGFCARRLI